MDFVKWTFSVVMTINIEKYDFAEFLFLKNYSIDFAKTLDFII